MNRLDTDRINDHSPYHVAYDEDDLVFTSVNIRQHQRFGKEIVVLVSYLL